jgi:Polyketide cyclase / dehydrase and lipid transport
MMGDSMPAFAGGVPDKPAGDSPGLVIPARGRGASFWLKWVVVGAAVLIVASFFSAYVLPREPEVTRSIDVAMPRAALFPLVADLRHLPEWSPRLTADPNVAVTFTGPLTGVGQTIAWQSRLPEVGSGAETITAIAPDSSVEMSVERAGQPSTTAWFRLDDKGAGETTVVWGYRKDVGFNPVDRYRGLSIDGVVGPGYERGLKRLKAFAETPPPNSDQPTQTN